MISDRAFRLGALFALFVLLGAAAAPPGLELTRPWDRVSHARNALNAGDPESALAHIQQGRAAAAGLGLAERRLFNRRLDELELRARGGDEAAQRALLERLSEALANDADRAALELEHAALLDRDTVRAARLELLLDHAAHEKARALEPLIDDGRLELDLGTRAKRVMALIRASRMERALLEAKAVPFPPPAGARNDDVVAFEVARIQALVRNDRLDEAAEHASRAFAAFPVPALLESKAWALGKARRLDDGAAAYAELAKVATDPGRKGDACFLAAFLRYENGQLDEAEVKLAACRPSLVEHARAADALWYRALIHYSQGRPQDALPLLRELLSAQPGHREVHKHRYWLARALVAAGDEKGSRAELKRLVRDAPLTYYGELARMRLGEKPIRGTRVPADALLRAAATDAPAQRTRALHTTGHHDAAKATLADRGKLDVATFGLAHAIDAPDFAYFRNAHVRPRRLIENQPSRGTRLTKSAAWRASYARPWSAIVDKAAATHGVDAAFVYAIMRTESGFDARATSRVGARGLLQLMPYTARGLAKVLGLPIPSADDLYRPDIVIPLGTAFLGLSTRELGHPCLAAAAYNGGPQHVVTWMKANGHLEPELFIERIPFKETRDYVKKTAITVALYRGLDGHDVVLDLPKAPVGAGPERFTWFPPDENE